MGGGRLEGLLSYPVLCLFRSQHPRQPRLGSLTVVLDTSTLAFAGLGDREDQFRQRQGRLTVAIARAAAGDLRPVLAIAPAPPPVDGTAACR